MLFIMTEDMFISLSLNYYQNWMGGELDSENALVTFVDGLWELTNKTRPKSVDFKFQNQKRFIS